MTGRDEKTPECPQILVGILGPFHLIIPQGIRDIKFKLF